jgi:TP901 family phage tail tape measure protein
MTSELGALRAKLLLESKQFKEGMQEARQEMLKSGKAADESSKEIKKIKDSMKSLDDSKKHAEEASKSLDKVSKSLRDVGLSSKQIVKIEEQIRKTNPQILENEIKEVREELVKLGMSSKEIDKITKEMREANNAVEKFQVGLNEIQLASLAVGVAVGVGVGASVKVAAAFEKQMSNVKAVSGATAQEMDKLSDMAMKLGESTSFSANEVAMGMEELIKAGLSVEQILNGGLAGALDLAAAGELDLASAAEIASTALNAFRDDNLTVSKAADILAGAANASATSVSELKFGLSAVSAVASSAGLSFEDTTTALAVFAQNGIKGSDAGTSLKTMLSNLSPSTKEATELMKKLGLITKDGSNQFYDAKGNLKSLADITDILKDSLDELNPKGRGDALEEMFGSDAVRAGSILFKEGAEGVEKMAAAMDKIKAADVAKVKLDNLISSFEEFQGTLETVGIKVGSEFLPMFKEIVNGGTDILRVFSELDPATVATGIKMAGAGAGVALLLATLGKLRLAITALQVTMGPAGWLILGASTLAAAYVGLSDTVARNSEVSLENYNAMKKNNDELQATISTFETLTAKNRLSSDEMQRFLDITTLLNQTADPAVITRLKDEQAKLSEKSGLSADEMSNLVKANDDIIKKVPDSTKVLSDQGNVLLKNADAAKKLSDEQLRGMRTELNEQKIKAEAKLNDLMDDREAALIRMNKAIERQKELIETRKSQEAFLAEQEAILADMKANKNLYAQKEIDLQQTIVLNAQDDVQLAKERAAKEQVKIDKQRESLAESDKELQKISKMNQDLINVELQLVGINNKKGDGIHLVDKEIAKLIEQKRQLDAGTSAKEKTTAEYQNAVAAIDKEIAKLHKARDAVAEITGAQVGVNSKVADGIALAQRLNEILSKRIDKTVNITEIKRLITQSERAARSLGVDTSRHQGGTFELPKFHEGGSPALIQSLMSAPNHNEIDVRLLRDEMVLTQAQQGQMFRFLDSSSVPNNNSLSQNEITELKALLGAIERNTAERPDLKIEMDKHQVGRLVSDVVMEEQGRQKGITSAFKGGRRI